MATRFYMKSNKCWYVRYKDDSGTWKSVSCGKQASAEDAELIRKNYDAKELNLKHKATIRIIKADLIKQLEYYRDSIVPRSNTGLPKSQKSIIRYKAIPRIFSAWCSNHNYAEYNSVTEKVIDNFFDKLIQDGNSTSTVTKYKHLLVNFFDWSIKEGYCTTNPVTHIPTPKRTKKMPRFFSESELKTIFAAAHNQYKNIYEFLYLTGLRIGELGNLEWSDYIKETKQILLRVIEGNKTKREEFVPLNPNAIEVLKKQEVWRSTLNTPDSHRYIFTNEAGLKLDNSNIYRNLKIICTNNNIFNASPHTFRHTCASHLAIKGVSIYVIKDILRQASVEESQVYAHLTRESVRNAIDLLKV